MTGIPPALRSTLEASNQEALEAARWKQTVQGAFDAAAPRYDDHAALQRDTLPTLIDSWQRLALPPHPPLRSWMDMGTGTGEAALALLPHVFSGHVLSSQSDASPLLYLNDCSEAMLGLAEKKIAKAFPKLQIQPCVGDSENLIFPTTRMDGISAHWVLQWIPHWQAALDHWWQHTQCLVVTVPLNDSFTEWKDVCNREGIASTLNAERYPSVEALKEWCHRHHAAQVIFHDETVTQTFESGHAFLRSLKAIGAQTPFKKTSTTPASALRRVLRATQGGFTVSTHVAWLVVSRLPETNAVLERNVT